MRTLQLGIIITLLSLSVFSMADDFKIPMEPPARVDYFFGDSVAYLPNGQSVGTSKSLVARKLWPGKAIIVEDVKVFDPGPNRNARQYLVVMKVQGDKFLMRELNGAFKGHGLLIGLPWNWTRWRSHSILEDGTILDSIDQITPSGLHVKKKLFKNDQLILEMKEQLRLISGEEYERIFATHAF